MSVLTMTEHNIDLNKEGFMTDASQWTPEIGQALATEAGIGELTEKHWQVINFCRDDAVEQGTPPGLRRISKLSGISMKELYQLFPKGPGKLAAKVSGLPKPKGCI